MQLLSFIQFLLEMPIPYKRQPEEDENVYYHASQHNFKPEDIRPMSHFGTHRAARARMSSDFNPFTPMPKHKANVMAYRVKLKKGWEIHDDLGSHTPRDIINMLHDHGHINSEEYETLKNDTSDFKSKAIHARMGVIADFLQSKGVDHLHYINKGEHPGSKSIIVVDPKSQVRPIFHNPLARINLARGKEDEGG